MHKTQYHVLGIMSGTSLDGIDLAQIKLQFDKKWKFSLLNCETQPYSLNWKTRLQDGIALDKTALKKLDEDYTSYLGETINTFIRKYQIKNLDAVCSHGHTILHQPEKGITFQIGNSPDLANMLQETVICDFRTQDVALGGQGAPLVPIGDKLLFSDYDFCLNLGGFANVSTLQDGKRIAYDVCPINIILNPFAEKLGAAFDNKGEMAASGKNIPELLEKLNALPFYKKTHPKSLGFEWVLKEVMPLVNGKGYKPQDVLHTFVEHMAMQLAMSFKDEASVFITGGGAYNDYLLDRLRFYKALKIEIPSSEIINYKEALIFGLLGVLKLRNEINCLQSVTGAPKDHSSGKIYDYLSTYTR